MDGFTIFDSDKLAWSGKPIGREIRLVIDLDAEQGRQPRAGVDREKNKFRISIKQTDKVGFASLMAHLAGKATFDNTCLEAINFADHVLRATSPGRSAWPKCVWCVTVMLGTLLPVV